jgi:Na+/H+-dicarboxylate symporter
MLVSSALGIAIAVLLKPGVGIDIASMHLATMTEKVAAAPSFSQELVQMVPTNPVAAFANGNVLQILVFALLLGFSINIVGDAAEPVVKLFRSFSAVVFTFARIIMGFAPYGIFALLAWVSGEYGWQALLPLIKLVATVYVGCFLLIIGYYFSVLLLFGINPFHFIANIADAIITAFSTSSSAATLPTSLSCA